MTEDTTPESAEITALSEELRNLRELYAAMETLFFIVLTDNEFNMENNKKFVLSCDEYKDVRVAIGSGEKRVYWAPVGDKDNLMWGVCARTKANG